MSSTDAQLISKLEKLDYGYCNPRKAKDATEDAMDLRAELRSRGFSDSEIDDIEDQY